MESNQLKISKNYDKNNESFDEEYARTQSLEHWIEEQENHDWYNIKNCNSNLHFLYDIMKESVK